MDAPSEEWIDVSNPDPGIPQEWVLVARKIIEKNEKASNCGRRCWELIGGVLRCVRGRDGYQLHHAAPDGLFRCGKRYRLGKHACSQRKNFRAEESETTIWEFVSGILKNPQRLRRGLDETLDRKGRRPRGARTRRGGLAQELSELEGQEERLLALYLEGKLEADRYGRWVSQLKQARKTVEEELGRIRNRASHIERLEKTGMPC